MVIDAIIVDVNANPGDKVCGFTVTGSDSFSYVENHDVTTSIINVGSNIIYFEPDNAVIAQNNEFELNINVAEIDDLFAFAFNIQYDPHYIEYVSAESGSLMFENCQAAMICENTQEDMLVLGITRLGFSCDGVAGPGNLAKIKFKAKISGDTLVAIYNKFVCVLEPGALSCDFEEKKWSDSIIKINPITMTSVM